MNLTETIPLCRNKVVQCVPLATEPGISLIILPLMRILQRNLKRTTDTFLFISHTTNVLLFKFRCNIFIGVLLLFFLFFFFFSWRYNPWWVLVCLRFRSTFFYLYTSLSNFSISFSLNLLLPVRATHSWSSYWS